MFTTPERADAIGAMATRVGLATVFGWIGAMKFTAYEAEAISGLVASSPLTGWTYALFDTITVSALIGSVEIVAAGLLLAGLVRPLLGAIGAAMVAGTLLVTASFLLTAPVAEASAGGFPALNVLPGQFLLKDLALLGAALWLVARDLPRATAGTPS
ncbi:MAG: DUF417 family protein [Pseudomonadota bacterium]